MMKYNSKMKRWNWLAALLVGLFLVKPIVSFNVRVHHPKKKNSHFQIKSSLTYSKMSNEISSPHPPVRQQQQQQQQRFQRTIPSIWNRSNTLEAAGLLPKTKQIKTTRADLLQQSMTAVVIPTTATRSSIGFLGHVGLFLLSTLLVKMIYRVFIIKKNVDGDGDDVSNEPKPAGIMNRCPWPFIFFHDFKQGFEDSPTWVVVMYVFLWRVVAKKVMIGRP